MRVLLCHPQSLAPDRVPRHERLEAALAGAVARAIRPVQLEHHVTELGGDVRRAAYTSPFTSSPPPIPVPSATITACRAPAAAPAASLGEHGFVSVVVHDHRQAETLAHQVAERQAIKRRQVGRPARHTVSPSTIAGTPKPITSTSEAAARTSSTASVNMSSLRLSAPRQVL